MSGPLLDRIDLVLDVPPVSAEVMSLHLRSRAACAAEPGATCGGQDIGGGSENSATVRARVTAAHALQRSRQGKPNARLQPAEIGRHCLPDAAGEALLAQAMTRLALSARAYHRVLKVARTIADLAGAPQIAAVHVAEAVGFRRFEAGVGAGSA